MKLQTDQFGEIEFSDENLLNLNEGLFGFEDLKKYVLIKVDDNFFYWLASTDNQQICFPLIGLRVIDDGVPQMENFEAFGIVTLDKDPLKITVNMKAPVYINQSEKTGFQKIIDDDKYSINYKLFVEN